MPERPRDVVLLGGLIFDVNVNLAYRGVFRKRDRMAVGMDAWRG